MLSEKSTMLILSCDKFSDLWDGHVKMLEQYWPDRNMNTFIVTDKKKDVCFPSVSVLSAGDNVEWSCRLKYALNYVNTEYVFVTLDDYYLIKKVDTNRIEMLIKLMDNKSLDYLRLYERPVRATKQPISGENNVFYVDPSYKYSVNLYSALWRKDFLLAMLDESLNAWEFEVSMQKKASEYGAKCAVSNNDDFFILDVVRKGKLLHKAARFFKHNPGIYTGNREINTWRYEIGLGIKSFVGCHTPLPINHAIRKVMKKFGYKFISD